MYLEHMTALAMREKKADDQEKAWHKVEKRALERAWDEEDSVWEKHHAKSKS